VQLAQPSQGPTTGGSLLKLIGAALLPHDFDAGVSPAPFDFDAVEIVLGKGDQNGVRITQRLASDFRTQGSDSDRLVFTMPPSPDGRPGEVDIILRVDLGAVTAEVVASLFLYANPDPVFGPRGAVFDYPVRASTSFKVPVFARILCPISELFMRRFMVPSVAPIAR
jgi:hypothetical protein